MSSMLELHNIPFLLSADAQPPHPRDIALQILVKCNPCVVNSVQKSAICAIQINYMWTDLLLAVAQLNRCIKWNAKVVDMVSMQVKRKLKNPKFTMFARALMILQVSMLFSMPVCQVNTSFYYKKSKKNVSQCIVSVIVFGKLQHWWTCFCKRDITCSQWFFCFWMVGIFVRVSCPLLHHLADSATWEMSSCRALI